MDFLVISMDGLMKIHREKQEVANDKGILVKCFISAKMCTILAIFFYLSRLYLVFYDII